MRTFPLSLAFLLCAATARAEVPKTTSAPEAKEAKPAKESTEEEIRDDEEKHDEKPAITVPVPEKPNLPLAGSSIKIGVPEKKQGSSLLWKPRWRKFGTGDYIVTGVSLALAAGSLAWPARPEAWNKPGFLFDEPARRGVRIRSEGWRLNVRDASDVLLSISSTYPFLVDSVMVAFWHRGSSIVATQMALMNAEAMALTAGVQGVVSALVSRERPYGRECSDPAIGSTEDCLRYNRYRSFFSGHTSQAFVSAMLTCAHHANLPLYGTRGADRAACVSHIALAFTIGAMRMLADMHYASDVITGAVVGSAIGLAAPYLLHYRGADPTAAATRSMWANVRVMPMPTGIAVMGSFG